MIIKLGKTYWKQFGSVPDGCEPFGVIMAVDGEPGILVQMPDGEYRQVNNGHYRNVARQSVLTMPNGEYVPIVIRALILDQGAVASALYEAMKAARAAYKGRKAKDGATDMKACTVYLDKESQQQLMLLGGGNLSLGIRMAAKKT